MLELSNRVHEHWALLRNASRRTPNLAVFIHGFRGSYLQTWGRLPTLLQQRAEDDPDFEDWDYLFCGYNTRDINTYLDIAALLLSHWQAAANGDSPFPAPYSAIALFGHSLGTLGIRQLLCAGAWHTRDLMDQIHSITLFGSPLNGSPLAPFALGYSVAEALKPNNPQLRMLRLWAETCYAIKPWPTVRLVMGQGDKVVGTGLSELVNWPGDAVANHTQLSHSDLVKPSSWNDSIVIDYIRRGLR